MSLKNGVPEESKREVNVHVTFLKIGDINTLKEQFSADILMRSSWLEPQLDYCEISQGTNGIDWGKYWDPKLSIDNHVIEPKCTSSRTLEKDANGHTYVVERRRLKGTFTENMELGEFPFDVQDLTISIVSEHPVDKISIIQDPDEVHKIYKQSFLDEQEWYLYKYVESQTITRLRDLADPTDTCQVLAVKCRAARRPEYFIWNIISVTALITFLAFATFSVSHDLPQNRLQLTFTLILTSVAFKFVAHQSIPRISYLTYLDRYILAAMINLTGICFWHALQTKIEVADRNDHVALIALIVIYVIYNIQFFLRILIVPYKTRRDMTKREYEYTKIVQHQSIKLGSSVGHESNTEEV